MDTQCVSAVPGFAVSQGKLVVSQGKMGRSMTSRRLWPLLELPLIKGRHFAGLSSQEDIALPALRISFELFGFVHRRIMRWAASVRK